MANGRGKDKANGSVKAKDKGPTPALVTKPVCSGEASKSGQAAAGQGGNLSRHAGRQQQG